MANKKKMKKLHVLLFWWHKFEDFDFGNILIDEKPHKSDLFCNISYKILIGANHCVLRFMK